MTVWNAYSWQGAPDDVTAAIATLSGIDPTILGPRTLDGVSYFRVRSVTPLTTPAGLTATGVQLAEAINGIWMRDDPVI